MKGMLSAKASVKSVLPFASDAQYGLPSGKANHEQQKMYIGHSRYVSPFSNFGNVASERQLLLLKYKPDLVLSINALR